MRTNRLVTRGFAALLAAGGTLMAAVLPAAMASASVWSSSAAFGNANIQGYTFNNNEWNGDHGSQRIWVNGARSWGVTSNQPGGSDVKTYPEEQANYSRAWSGYRAIWSRFKESGPASGDWEAAYDIWVGAPPNTSATTEVMIWVDNHGQYPAGQIVGQASIAGQSWQIFYTPDVNGHRAYSFVLNSVSRAHERSGIVHVLDTFRWMQRHGDLRASAPLTQIDWGWEICSTGGSNLTFTTSHFGIHTQG